jgi:DNA-binding transcriptional LysR family regulator
MIDPFARRRISLERLRSFVAVADAGGMARAAPGNAIRQSQFSRQIAELEEHFAMDLIERRGTGIVLTAAGEKLAVVARETFARLQEVAAMRPDERIDVAIGADGKVIRWWIAPNIHAFGRTRIKMSARSDLQTVTGLFDAQLDFGIVHTSEVHRGLRARPLGMIEYALYVPKQLAPKGKRLGVKELLQQLPIGVLEGRSSFGARLDAVLRRANVRFTPVFICNELWVLHEAVAAGTCAAVLPTLARAELPRSTFSEHRDAILDKHDGRMSLAWTPRLEQQRPRVAALIPGIVRAIQR